METLSNLFHLYDCAGVFDCAVNAPVMLLWRLFLVGMVIAVIGGLLMLGVGVRNWVHDRKPVPPPEKA